ncbi:SMP-30/gluconolactonase/LRE family protein [Novosphingobium organovorum]|nr:major royal jelly family protein [Novosphingobium organovorum]
MTDTPGLFPAACRRRALMKAFASCAVGAALAPGLAPTLARAASATPARASGALPPLEVAAVSPDFLCNAVALTRDNTMFLGLPRWLGMDGTPSLVRVDEHGALHSFPGGEWNAWQAGKDPRNALVMVNGIHIFADDTLWVVDQGTADRKLTMAGAQKLIQFDPTNGKALRILRFGPDILPEGAQMNDLRIHDNRIYVTDSGRGAIIVHDLDTGKTLRRLSGKAPVMEIPGEWLMSAPGHPLEDANGVKPHVQCDMLELTADGQWLYFCTPTGPLRRVSTKALWDTRLDEDALAGQVETVTTLPTLMGTTMDSLGNFYYTDITTRRIMVLTPGGKQLVLAQDQRLVDGDAMFISADRHLYMPCPQTERLAVFNQGKNGLQPPWQIFRLALPETLEGHPLGVAVP